MIKSANKIINLSRLLQIASGMSELHRIGIVHGQLGARSVMLDKRLQAKVGKFGLAHEGTEYAMDTADADGNKKRIGEKIQTNRNSSVQNKFENNEEREINAIVQKISKKLIKK